MKMVRLSDLARRLGAPSPCLDGEITGFCVDSRQVRPGDLFVALRGERHDGHDFIADVVRQGASAVIASKNVEAAVPVIRVDDTVAALGELALLWRNRFNVPLIAVAGSNGKTTVKEMLREICECAAPDCVLATRGNLNNHIGVPLTLGRLTEAHRYAVIEIGANGPNEIAHLARISQPGLGLITNAGHDHVAGFGGPEGAARANGEMFAVMPADRCAVLNADDPCFPIWKKQAGNRPIIRFGLDCPDAEVHGEWKPLPTGGMLSISSPWGDLSVELAVMGRHNGLNALAAAAATLVLGISTQAIKEGLIRMRPISGRLQVLTGLKGSRIIDDSYNANPSSLDAALQILTEMAGEKVLVLGDMGEMGDTAGHWHAWAGRRARESGVNLLFACGDLSRIAVEAFGQGALHFESSEALAVALRKCLHDRLTVLVKGSRFMRMERVVESVTVAS